MGRAARDEMDAALPILESTVDCGVPRGACRFERTFLLTPNPHPGALAKRYSPPQDLPLVMDRFGSISRPIAEEIRDVQSS
jgi:hypothetical protein